MIGQMALAYAIARHKRMLAEDMTYSQRRVAARFGDLIFRQLAKLSHERRKRVYKMAAFFEDM